MADDIFFFWLDAGKVCQRDEFRKGLFCYIKYAEDTDAVGCRAGVEGSYLQKPGGVVGDVDVLLYALRHRVRAEDDCFPALVRLPRGNRGDCSCGHGFDERDGVLAWCICDVDGTTGDAARGGVEARVWVGGLEHVPVRQDV